MGHVIAVIIVIGILYVVFHGFHTRRKWRHYKRLPWHRRIWISVPGPFGTRIGRRVLHARESAR